MRSLKKTLILLAAAGTGLLVNAVQECRAEARNGILYDMTHPGNRCDSYGDGGLGSGLRSWLWSEAEYEKWKTGEDLRILQFKAYLKCQNSKHLLHRECSPYFECHYGYYPTCWRPFPGQPQCPPQCSPMPPDTIYYESDPAYPNFEGPNAPYEADSPNIEMQESELEINERELAPEASETPYVPPSPVPAPLPSEE